MNDNKQPQTAQKSLNFTMRVSKIRNKPMRRLAIVATYPLLIITGIVFALFVALQWFANAQIGLARSAARTWRMP